MTGRFLAGAATGIALLVATGFGTAQATTFAELTLEQFTDASTYIVEGHVEEVWTELDPQTSLVWTRARVSITETYKGPDEPVELIIDSAGGRVGDYEVYIPGAASFSVGEDVFVFLAENGPHWVPISKFQGKYTIRRAPGERQKHVMQWQARRGETFDARFLPHPDPEARLYLDELRQRVTDQLAVGWDGRPIPGISPGRLELVNTPDRRIAR
jgi:hypothetical protein